MNTETLSGATSVSAEAEVIIEDMGSKISPSPPSIGQGSIVSPSIPVAPVSSLTKEEMDVSSISWSWMDDSSIQSNVKLDDSSILQRDTNNFLSLLRVKLSLRS